MILLAYNQQTQGAVRTPPLRCGLSISEAREAPYAIWLPSRRDAAMWMGLPPIGLLLLGYAIAWIAQGFRVPQSK
jgi:hypothetical protein